MGDPGFTGSTTLSLVDVKRRSVVASVPAPGRTRWTVFDKGRGLFYVNVADPPVILVVDAADPSRVKRSLSVPSAGPHGMDLDEERALLFCACDSGKLVVLDTLAGDIRLQLDLSGPPDVVFLNAALGHLYVAVGNPGVVDVVDLHAMRLLQNVPTEKGAHTIAFDARGGRVYAFLPQTHRAAVFEDR